MNVLVDMWNTFFVLKSTPTEKCFEMPHKGLVGTYKEENSRTLKQKL